MIDFRYHLVSIVAIFLSLAVGVVLGTTMLQDPLLNTLKAETADLREQSEQLRSEKDIADQLNAGGDEMVAAHADDMLEERLDGVRVVIMEAPGVEEEMRDDIIARIEQAGGTVPGRLAFAEKYIDTGQAAFVDELTEELSNGAELPDGNPYERAGAQLAQAVLEPDTEDAGRSDDEENAAEEDTSFDADAVLAGFAETELLAVHGDPAESADIGLVLGPAYSFAVEEERSPETEEETPPGNGVMLALVRALYDASDGAVLAGPTSSIGVGGLVAQARHEEARYSTVDAAGRTTGNVATVLVLAAATEGRSGSFGIGQAAEGFLPDPLPEAKSEAEENDNNNQGSE
ncbi:copper transporter [Allosalinactinospora lopnorensis]|uniref:copper transporter n=1 Tax=Allosalinactinospora lopnorensis TaxID=1352348 RepID=UPI000623EF44|nr:copper transporter [Allosalinactinospora lopnorensis]